MRLSISLLATAGAVVAAQTTAAGTADAELAIQAVYQLMPIAELPEPDLRLVVLDTHGPAGVVAAIGSPESDISYYYYSNLEVSEGGQRLRGAASPHSRPSRIDVRGTGDQLHGTILAGDRLTEVDVRASRLLGLVTSPPARPCAPGQLDGSYRAQLGSLTGQLSVQHLAADQLGGVFVDDEAALRLQFGSGFYVASSGAVTLFNAPLPWMRSQVALRLAATRTATGCQLRGWGVSLQSGDYYPVSTD
jgi:hypothetical protein